MSTYSPTPWVNGQAPAIDELNLDKQERGVESAHVEIEQFLVDVPVGRALSVDFATTCDFATSVTLGGFKHTWDDTTFNLITQ